MDLHIALSQGFQDGEHHALFAQGRRVFDLKGFRELQQLGRLLFLEVLKRHPLDTVKQGVRRDFFCHGVYLSARKGGIPGSVRREPSRSSKTGAAVCRTTRDLWNGLARRGRHVPGHAKKGSWKGVA